MKKVWQNYYARRTRIQDAEIGVVRPIFYLSRGSVTNCFYVPSHGKWESWYIQEEFRPFLNKLGRLVLSQKWNVKKHLDQFFEVTKNLRSVIKIIDTTSATASTKQLLKNYQKLCEAYKKLGLFIWLPWSLAYFLEDWFTDHLKLKFTDWQEMYEIIARPDRASNNGLMREAVWKWKINGAQSSVFEKIIAEFGYLNGYSANDRFWTKSEILKQVGNLKNCQQKLKETHLIRQKNRRDFIKVLKLIKSTDKQLAQVAETIHVYAWLRDQRIEEYKRALVLSSPFYRRLEREFGWKKYWAVHLTKQEVHDALTGKKLISKKELAKRAREDYIYYISNKNTRVITDGKLKNSFLANKNGFQFESNLNEISGKIAFPGRVTGKIKLITRSSDCKQFTQGNILLSSMTHPDFIPAIRQAKAIITDEGGITCHASIMARELKIPCLIGTRIATKIFKDGDLVEVDAIKGIVRKV